MADSSEKFKDLDYLISRVGMPAVMLGVICYFFFVKFETYEREFHRHVEVSIRNERAIMQKLGIPVILDGAKIPGEK